MPQIIFSHHVCEWWMGLEKPPYISIWCSRCTRHDTYGWNSPVKIEGGGGNWHCKDREFHPSFDAFPYSIINWLLDCYITDSSNTWAHVCHSSFGMTQQIRDLFARCSPVVTKLTFSSSESQMVTLASTSFVVRFATSFCKAFFSDSYLFTLKLMVCESHIRMANSSHNRNVCYGHKYTGLSI